MGKCTETKVRGFSDKRPVPVLSAYAYQKAVSLALAFLGGRRLRARGTGGPLDLPRRRRGRVKDGSPREGGGRRREAAPFTTARPALAREPQTLEWPTSVNTSVNMSFKTYRKMLYCLDELGGDL
jgi:hypothetical protein